MPPAVEAWSLSRRKVPGFASWAKKSNEGGALIGVIVRSDPHFHLKALVGRAAARWVGHSVIQQVFI